MRPSQTRTENGNWQQSSEARGGGWLGRRVVLGWTGRAEAAALVRQQGGRGERRGQQCDGRRTADRTTAEETEAA